MKVQIRKVVLVVLIVVSLLIVLDFALKADSTKIRLTINLLGSSDYFLDSSMILSNITVVSNKWIVITSINYPTEDVKRLVQSGWNLVVVGDKKTPQDWNLKGVHFLSVQRQKKLGLKLPGQLPLGKYTRKNVGYLYAIMKGAEWIYDTDDDNKPYGLGLNQFDFGETKSGIRFQEIQNSSLKSNVFNPYSYFGNSSMWPRGFPLEMLNNHSNGIDRMVSCREMKSSDVQQGLVHKDPDVDAIYRLMHADAKTGLNEKFDKFAPAITLEPGTYSPWNSQNTLIKKNAFFTLFLPSSVEFRVTDIWRSYFLQKLLHLIGETIAFYPVNAIQIRNAHNYLADFEDERAVYLKSGKIIKTLSEWKCSANTTERCTLELAETFSYEFPPLVEHPFKYDASEERNSNCIRVHMDFSQISQFKSFDQRQQNIEEIAAFCEKKTNISMNISRVDEIKKKQESSAAIKQKQNTVLILNANFPWKSGIGVLQRLYEPYFAVTIFCGTWNQTDYDSNELFPSRRSSFNYIHLSQKQMNQGVFMYYCISKARDLKLQNIEGYYMVSDDTVFNIWHNIEQDKIVYPLGWEPTDLHHWDKPFGKEAADRMVNELVSQKYANHIRVQSAWKKYDELSWKKMNQSGAATIQNINDRAFVDVFYVPTPHMYLFAEIFELMFEAGLYLELAVGKMFHVFDVKYFRYRNETKFLWYDGKRPYYYKYYNALLVALHPIKFGEISKNGVTMSQFCNSVIRTFVDSLF